MLRQTLPLGSPAPDFEALDQHGHTIRLADLLGRWVILYFYPKDRTTGCIAEACGFRDRADALTQEEAVVVGVSRDSIRSHSDFARRHNFSFSLLADPTAKITNAYKAGGFFGVPRRITYVIDPDGHIAKAYRFVRPKRHAATILVDLRALKTKRGTLAPIGASRTT